MVTLFYISSDKHITFIMKSPYNIFSLVIVLRNPIPFKCSYKVKFKYLYHVNRIDNHYKCGSYNKFVT